MASNCSMVVFLSGTSMRVNTAVGSESEFSRKAVTLPARIKEVRQGE